ncbi:MAG: DUF2339 domain-containing protein [Deltaproteobacteria bacterium]|nr:DUF2339 domain-containing protein [Deltaproteobacteria bacterium]
MREILLSTWRAWTRIDQKMFLYIGGFFLFVAAALTVREIDVDFGYTLGGIALLSAVVSLRGRDRSVQTLGLAGVLVCSLASSLLYVWLIPYRIGAYLLSPAVLLVASLVWISRHESARRAGRADVPVGQRLIWFCFGSSLLVTSWAAYYQFLSYGLLEDVPLRRLLLSAFWLVAGLIFYVIGRQRRERRMRTLGLILLSLALAKLWWSDTPRLKGYDRILALAIAGVLMVLGGISMRRLRVDADRATEPMDAGREPAQEREPGESEKEPVHALVQTEEVPS